MGNRTIVLVAYGCTAFVGGVDVSNIAQATEVREVFIVVKRHTDVVALGTDMLVD